MKRSVVNPVTISRHVVRGSGFDRPKSTRLSQPALARKPDRNSATFHPGLRSRSKQNLYLPELINLAEQNNPDTRVAWENAKARAADLGISKATLYPTLAAVAVAESVRD